MLDFLTGAIVSLPPAYLVWRRGSITTGGAATGVALAGVVYAGMYLGGLAVLLTALLLVLCSSRLGHAKKTALGIAEQRGGRRGALNVLANCGVGAIGAVVEAGWQGFGADLNAVIFVAGIAAGASDTVASEIGKTFAARPRAFPTWRCVLPGTPGAVSVPGTLAGVVGAAIIALPAVLLWVIPPSFLPRIVAACVCGAFLESALATRFEDAGYLGNHQLNLINTFAAAGIALWLCA